MDSLRGVMSPKTVMSSGMMPGVLVCMSEAIPLKQLPLTEPTGFGCVYILHEELNKQLREFLALSVSPAESQSVAFNT